MVDFTIKNLEVFLAVVEKNSFSLAANELYLSQSTVSTAISTLESSLGVTLLVRNARRRIELTEDGKLLYPIARRIVENCDDLRAMFQSKERTPLLLIGASNVPAQYILPDLMSDFLRLCPSCRYVLEQGDSMQIHQMLEKESVRIGFAGSRQEDPRFIYTPIGRDRLVLATQNNERFAALRRNGAFGKELLGEPMIAREDGSGTEGAFIEYLQRTGYPADSLHVVARLTNTEAIQRMVERGAGVAVLSHLAVEDRMANDKILTFELDDPCPEREIYMIYRKDCKLTEQEQQFISFVRRQSDETAAKE